MNGLFLKFSFFSFFIFFQSFFLLNLLEAKNKKNFHKDFYQDVKRFQAQKRKPLFSPHKKTHLLLQPKRDFNEFKLNYMNENFLSIHTFKLQSKGLKEPATEQENTSKTVQKIHLDELPLSSNYKISHSLLFLYPILMNHSLGLRMDYDYEGSTMDHFLKSNETRSDVFKRYLEFNHLVGSKGYEAKQLSTLLVYRAYYNVSNIFLIHYGFSSYLLGLLSFKESNHLLYSLFSEAILSRPDLSLYTGLFLPLGKNNLLWFLFDFGYFIDRKDDYSLVQTAEKDGEIYQEDYSFYDRFQNEPKYEFKVGYEMEFNKLNLRFYLNYILLNEALFTHARVKNQREEGENIKAEYKNLTRLQFIRNTLHTVFFGLDVSFYFLSSFLTSVKLKYQVPGGSTEVITNTFIDQIGEDYKVSHFIIQSEEQYSITFSFAF